MAKEDIGELGEKIIHGVNRAKVYAPVAVGVAKTFMKGTAGSNSEKDIDYGPGPAPKSPAPPKPPADYYKEYRNRAGQGSKRSTKRGMKR